MQKIEDILDIALTRIKNGEEISSVILNVPAEHRECIAANLSLAQIGITLPKKDLPVPTKRRRFLTVKPQARFARLREFMKLYSVALTSLVLIIAGVAYGAANSVPGDKLFSLKRIFESAQINLASNQESKAQLQLNFANARLADAEKAIASDNSQIKSQAIAELNSQTQVALNNIKKAVSSGSKDPSIVAQIKNLTQNQTNLIAKIDPSQAKSISQSNQKQVAEIQTLIAASDDQASATVPQIQNIDTVGAVTAIKDQAITIDKNLFQIDSNTVIQAKDGSPLQLSDIGIGDTVEVKGQTKNNSNIAQYLILIEKKPKSAVKPSIDQNSNGNSTLDQTQNSQDQNAVSEPQKPADTFGTFIPEPSYIQ